MSLIEIQLSNRLSEPCFLLAGLEGLRDEVVLGARCFEESLVANFLGGLRLRRSVSWCYGSGDVF